MHSVFYFHITLHPSITINSDHDCFVPSFKLHFLPLYYLALRKKPYAETKQCRNMTKQRLCKVDHSQKCHCGDKQRIYIGIDHPLADRYGGS